VNKFFTIILLLTFIFIHKYTYSQDEYELDTLSRNDFIIYSAGGIGFYYLIHNDPQSDLKITASTIINFGVSYDITSRLNVAFELSKLNFPSNKDSLEEAKGSLTGLTFRYKTLKSKKTNIYLGLSTGTSNFKYFNYKTSTKVTASNIFLEPNIGFNHYWGKTVGFFIQTSYYYTNYNRIVNKENKPLKVIVNGKEENFTLAFSGLKLLIGLQFKF
jgi:hypothetical protein